MCLFLTWGSGGTVLGHPAPETGVVDSQSCPVVNKYSIILAEDSKAGGTRDASSLHFMLLATERGFLRYAPPIGC